MKYNYTKQLEGDFNDILNKLKESLTEVGFGVLVDLNIKETMKEKIGAEYDEYRILGVCNPMYANEILQIEKKIGLFLPCNIIVYQEGDNTNISMLLPTLIPDVIEDTSIDSYAKEVEDKLKQAINNIN